jgi:L-asparaginase / beta-aspartyl-peptidase
VMESALRAAWAVLDGGGPALTAVVDAVAVLEDSGKFNAGRGGARTISGELELDAAVMDGRTGRAGAVCATSWPRNPVRVARAVADAGGPPERPVLLAGAGADLFAAGTGLLEMDASPPQAAVLGESGSPTGTVGAVAVDSSGHLAAATSTGGREGQLRGRVGDSPIIGAGTWADDETAAVSATGEGEAFLIAGFAHLMDWSLRNGSSLDDAVFRSMEEVARRGGTGGTLAMTSSGELVCAFGTRAMARGWKDATQTKIAVLGDKAASYGRKGDDQAL